MVLSIIAIAMTVGVYGFVAAIVKLDDLGLYLVGTKEQAGTNEQAGAKSLRQSLGFAILWFAPWLMKTLSVLGTAAMFLVGGGIVSHGIEWLHHVKEAFAHWVLATVFGPGAASGWIDAIVQALFDGVLGLICGAVVLMGVSLFRRVFLSKNTRETKA